MSPLIHPNLGHTVYSISIFDPYFFVGYGISNIFFKYLSTVMIAEMSTLCTFILSRRMGTEPRQTLVSIKHFLVSNTAYNVRGDFKL